MEPRPRVCGHVMRVVGGTSDTWDRVGWAGLRWSGCSAAQRRAAHIPHSVGGVCRRSCNHGPVFLYSGPAGWLSVPPAGSGRAAPHSWCSVRPPERVLWCSCAWRQRATCCAGAGAGCCWFWAAEGLRLPAQLEESTSSGGEADGGRPSPPGWARHLNLAPLCHTVDGWAARCACGAWCRNRTWCFKIGDTVYRGGVV